MVGPAIGHGEEAAHAHLPLVEFAVTLGFLGPLHAGVRLVPRAARRRAAEGPGARGVPGVSVVDGSGLRLSGLEPEP